MLLQLFGSQCTLVARHPRLPLSVGARCWRCVRHINPCLPRILAGLRQDSRTRAHKTLNRWRQPVGTQQARSRRGQVAQPDLHIGYALRRQRVASQIGERAVVVEPVDVLQLLKHSCKTSGIKTRQVLHLQPLSIGLSFHVARKVKVALRGHCLTTQQGGICQLGVLSHGQGAQHHGGH